MDNPIRIHTKRQNDAMYAYAWHVDPSEREITSIRIYGLDENEGNVCVRVTDFTPYAYIELPENIHWTDGKVQLVLNKIDSIAGDHKPITRSFVMKKKLYGAHLDAKGEYKKFPYLFCAFSSPSDIRPLSYRINKTHHIVGVGVIKMKMHEIGANPILQLVCCRKLPTAGWIAFQGLPQTNPEDKLTLCDKEYTVSWKRLSAYTHPTASVPKPLIMAFDIEVNSTNPNMMPNPNMPGDKVFQISCVFAREADPSHAHDDVLLTLGDPEPNVIGTDVEVRTFKTEPALLEGFTDLVRERNPNIISGYNILGFDIQYMIYRAQYTRCISEFDLHGFHKYKHAEEKTIQWSSSGTREQKFSFLDIEGRLYVDLLPLVRKDFKMSNYRLNTIAEHFLGSVKDPLTVKGIFKCYRIGTEKKKRQTGSNKSVYGNRARRAMGIVGKYCVQDSVLVIRLMDKLKTWPGLTEMARICNVPIFTLYTQGQQNRVFSQLYKYCTYKNIVVETDAYQTKENERYVGAYVFHPVAGVYDMIVPVDFASLYPTTIIANNIDYHTWVQDGSSIPDSMCNVMSWEDHVGCEHDPKVIRIRELTTYINTRQEHLKKMAVRRDAPLYMDDSVFVDTPGETSLTHADKKRIREQTRADINAAREALKPYIAERSELCKGKTSKQVVMCEKRHYRFLKGKKGVVPSIIQDLLDARKRVRREDMADARRQIALLKENGEQEASSRIQDLKGLLDILDKRQLALKVSANSMYGAMGVRKGKLPFMPGAMCTTYMGRENIKKVAEVIPRKFGGKIIYGDTDSNYIHFPHLKSAQETWDYAEHVASEVTKMFPAPIKLEFEEELYAFFFILTKKRYMYRKCFREGIVEDKMGKKGVLLARRDNSKFVRDVYEDVINAIADRWACVDVLNMVLDHINAMCSGCKPRSDFVITKSVGETNDLTVEVVTKPDGSTVAQMGRYTTPLLPQDPVKREEKIRKKKAVSENDYYLKCLQAHIQLAEKMRRRGRRVDVGSRLEYVVTGPEKHRANNYEKLEDVDYAARHGDIIKIDYMYYLNALATPLDQMLNVAFQNDPTYTHNFTDAQYKLRSKAHMETLHTIQQLSRPRIVIRE